MDLRLARRRPVRAWVLARPFLGGLGRGGRRRCASATRPERRRGDHGDQSRE
jgi:hypothetical protein